MDKLMTKSLGSGRRSANFPSYRFTAKVLSLVALGVLLMAMVSLFFGVYVETVLIRSFLFAVAALTVGVLWGYTGILSFSQSTFFGIGTYAAALAFTHVGFSIPILVLSLLAAIVVAGCVAGVTGWFAFWYRATPFYVAVVTLVLAIAAMQLVYSGGDFTGSSSGLVGFDVPSLSMTAWFWLSGCLLILFTVAVSIFLHSDYGVLLKAIRDNEERCRYLGINSSKIKIILFTVMGSTASIAGFMYACVTVLAAPEHVGFVFGTQLVINTALGGRASILGPVLGTISLESVSAYLNGVLPFVWQLIIGVVFIVVIVALPEGLLPPFIKFLSKHFAKCLGFSGKAGREIDIVEEQNEAPPKQAVSGKTAALSLKKLSRSYGHLQVLKELDLDVGAGEIVGIVGPNGAGKTTLMSCISDGLERSGGDIYINDVSLHRQTPTQIVELGLARSFQKTSVYENLTVGECLLLALQRQFPLSKFKATGLIRLPASAWNVLQSTKLIQQKDVEVRNLSHGMKRALELTMALSLRPSILLLDEPTAGLTKADRELVGSVLMGLSGEQNLTIVLIEHDFDFVKRVCSRLVVLHQGGLIMDGSVDEVVNSPTVLDIYSGHA